MATTTRVAKVTFKSKSDHARALLAEGKTIADLTRLIPGMGYAFAYGIAKRTPHPDGGSYAERAANRRSVKSVTTVGDIVQVEIVDPSGKYLGRVSVNRTTGAVTTKKVKATTK